LNAKPTRELSTYRSHGAASTQAESITWEQLRLMPLNVLMVFGFWFLVCNAVTQLALQVQQERIQLVRSNQVVCRLLTESNGTPAMELVFKDIGIRRYTNKKGTEQNTHPKTRIELL